MNFPGTEIILTAIFLMCLAAVGTGALIAVLSQRLIRSVVGLAICCFGLAGLYYFLHSPFLALMEILIYVGAVCVTIVFAVMLAEPDEPSQSQDATHPAWWTALALVICVSLFWVLWRMGAGVKWPSVIPIKPGSIDDIGISLLTTYSLAFEMISLALLVAILGALAVARTGRTKA